MHAPPPPPTVPDARRRVVAEASIVDLIVLCGWALDVRDGAGAHAWREGRATLERWIGLGLPFARAGDGSRRFDPVEVTNFYKHAGRERGDRYWPDRVIVQSRTLVLDMQRGTPSFEVPPSVSTLPRERFVVTLEREFGLPRGDPGAPLLLRLPLPVEDHVLTDLRVEFLGPPGAELAAAPGRLDVRIPHPGGRTAIASVCASFLSDPSRHGLGATALDDDERALYTRPREGLVKVSGRVAALAVALADGARDPLAVVRRFVDHLIDHFTLGGVYYDRLDPESPLDTILDAGWFDCQMASALLVALCRARAMPARLVSGYQMLPPTPGAHFWAEVWIDDRGWLPFDSSAADLSACGRDAPWRDYYFGRLDHRMKTQILPRVFNYAPSILFPVSWHTLAYLDGDGIAHAVFDSATGALVYRDRVVARRGEALPGAPRSDLPGHSVNATPL